MNGAVDLTALVTPGSQKNLEENLNDGSNGTRDQKKWDWFAIGICIGMALLAILSLVSIWTYARQTNGKVWQFSVHAYQGPVRNLALSGPFLGKVRVDGTSTEISNSAKELFHVCLTRVSVESLKTGPLLNNYDCICARSPRDVS